MKLTAAASLPNTTAASVTGAVSTYSRTPVRASSLTIRIVRSGGRKAV